MTDVELVGIEGVVVDPDGRVHLVVFGEHRHVGWLDREVGTLMYGAEITRWRARTAEGSSLGSFSSRGDAIRAIITRA